MWCHMSQRVAASTVTTSDCMNATMCGGMLHSSKGMERYSTAPVTTSYSMCNARMCDIVPWHRHSSCTLMRH